MRNIGKTIIVLAMIMTAVVSVSLVKAETTFSDQGNTLILGGSEARTNPGGGGRALLPPVTPIYQTYTYGSTTKTEVALAPKLETPSVSLPIISIPSITAPPSNISFDTKNMKTTYFPSQVVAYGYQYKNKSSKTSNVKIVRTIKDGKGKVIEQSEFSTKLKPQAVFARQIRTLLPRTFNPGIFTVQITVYSGEEVIDQKSLLFSVQLAVQSNISFLTKSMKASYRPAQMVAYGYQYKNPSSKMTAVKIVRTVKNGDGKVIERSELNTKLKSRAVFTRQIQTRLKKDAELGTYVITILVYSGSVAIDQRSLNFIVGR
ncbi:MAG: hypothetical protein PHC53_01855 [Patescibacteria group bacterium]|nr:hypothetical protein [Patescibacteria group bacterium]